MDVVSQDREVRQAKAFARAPLLEVGEVDVAKGPKSLSDRTKTTAAPEVGEPGLHLERDEQSFLHGELRPRRMRNRTGLLRSPGSWSHRLAAGTLADLTIECPLTPSYRKCELARQSIFQSLRHDIF